jgi:hypothetical protein
MLGPALLGGKVLEIMLLFTRDIFVVIARSVATKQSTFVAIVDCFASLAMTKTYYP